MKKIARFFNAGFSPFTLKKSATLTNPYVKDAEGQKVWNDRYGTLQQSIRSWRIACFASLMVSVVLAGVVAYIATTSKVQPFIVETHEGMPYAIAPMHGVCAHDQRLINFAINQFIVNARTVVNDSLAQKALLDKVYAYSANQTLAFLHDYYQNHNPFDSASHATVTAAIVSSLPTSGDTWQITWDETEHNVADSNVTRVTRWVANVTYQLGDVNPHFMTANPFGLYVTQLVWTPTLQGE